MVEAKRGLGLAAVLLVSLALGVMWLLRVPMFESPDENAHADYAFTLFSTRAPVPLAGRRLATNVHPLVDYLETVSAFGHMHYDPDGRAPADYGSRAFYRGVDASAPAVPRDFLEHTGGRVPYVVRSYAYLYYALDALGIGLGAALSGNSATAEFFAARGFNLVLLLCSLTLAYLTFRELRFSYRNALALTATIGFFPLTSWVSAYVQPDNLAFTAVTLALYLALRVRDEPSRLAGWGRLGLALALLALTKAQYFVVVALPVLAGAALGLAARRAGWRAWAARAALVIGPALVAGATLRGSLAGAGQLLSGGAVFENPLQQAAHAGPWAFASTAGGLLSHAFFSTFFSGLAFSGYWGGFAWDDAPIGFGSGEVTRAVYALLGAGSLLVAVLTAVRLALGVWPRLLRVARARGVASAARLLLRDVHLNAYLAFVALMLGLNVFTGGVEAAAGRYWLPLIVCSLLCAVRCAPRALPRRVARPFASTLGAAALLYSVAAAAASPAAIEARFYRPAPHPLEVESDALIRHVGGFRVPPPGAPPLHFRAGERIRIDGVALDSHATLPVRYVDVAVDGAAAIRARYGLPEPNVVAEMHDDRLLPTGYSALLDLRGFAPGPHELRLLVGETGRAAPRPSAVRVPFTIDAPGGAVQAGNSLRAPR